MTMHKTREDESRKREWKEPNELDVPESLVRRLKSEGFGTRWIRISAEGKPDPVNVMTRLREGYEFVKREDAPEWEVPDGCDPAAACRESQPQQGTAGFE
jgi:hypothetical protein